MVKERNDKLEKLTSTLQKMLDGNPSILIGSGGSIPYGLPSMFNLQQEIKTKLNEKYSGNEAWDSFIHKLDEEQNLENALEEITLEKTIHDDLIWCVWSLVYEKDSNAYHKILRKDLKIELSSILNKFIQQTGVTNIITTNYDRLIEYAIDNIEGKCFTGFTDGYIRKFSSFAKTKGKRCINVYKVHGSIDWFKNCENDLFSLRTFNKDILSDSFYPLIVTPGNSKYKETHSDPFRTVIANADEALRSSCAYLCIGYGFNDEHIQPIIIDENRNKRKPVVIVTKDITPKIRDIFYKDEITNCLIISSNENGGSTVCYSKTENDNFDEEYWRIGDLYKLWFE